MASKKYKLAQGKYYFRIKTGHQNITIFRKDKKTAQAAFDKYAEVGKDCEWLGKWNGKNFVDA